MSTEPCSQVVVSSAVWKEIQPKLPTSGVTNREEKFFTWERSGKVVRIAMANDDGTDGVCSDEREVLELLELQRPSDQVGLPGSTSSAIAGECGSIEGDKLEPIDEVPATTPSAEECAAKSANLSTDDSPQADEEAGPPASASHTVENSTESTPRVSVGASDAISSTEVTTSAAAEKQVLRTLTELRFKRTGSGVNSPIKSEDANGCAHFDIQLPMDLEIAPGDIATVLLGVRIISDAPASWTAAVEAPGLVVLEVDGLDGSDELKAQVKNEGAEAITIHSGTALVQLRPGRAASGDGAIKAAPEEGTTRVASDTELAATAPASA